MRSLRLAAFLLLSLLTAAHSQLVNVALSKPTSGDVAFGFPTSNGVDGTTATFTHADNTNAAPNNPYWQVDLVQNYDLTRLEITDRADGCCSPNRLNGSQIRVFDANNVQVGATITISGLSIPSSGQTLVFSNGATGWPAARRVRIDGFVQYFQFSEFRAFIGQPGANENLALNRTVTCSVSPLAGYPASNITDGNRSTFSHPADGAPTGAFYTIDLGVSYGLDRVVLFNRNDGSGPERLSNYRVQLLADNAGAPGVVNWSGDLRTDGSNSGAGGSDIVRSGNGIGTFFGRFIRITDLANLANRPQIAEVEAYSAPRPTIRFFAPDDGNLTTGGSATLSWLVENYASISINQGVGALGAASGTVSVSPGTTTTYTLTATNVTGATTATVTVGVNEAETGPLINEFLADNNGGLADEDGDQNDWIELKNPNVFTLNLAGFYLTDSALNKTKWVFPSVAVPPGGYLVVFASNKNRAVLGFPLHTNFKLSKSGSYLGLIAANGTTAFDEFSPAYPQQFSDKSYGRAVPGNAFKFFSPPTPGAVNTAGFDGVVTDTQFSLQRGFYSAPQSVTISTATPGATIRYTTNGTIPTLANGTTYSAPINISTTTTLRAAAFKTNFVPANTDTQTYLFVNAVAAGLQTSVAAGDLPNLVPGLTDLPSLSIVTPNSSAFNNDTETPISLEWLNPDNTPGFQINCGTGYFGGAFTDFAKKSFRVYFRGEYGASSLEYPAFAGFARGLTPAQKFNALELRNGSHDMVARGFYMSNTFTDDTMLDMGNLNPHSRYVHLYINGAYWGMYHLRERWSAKMSASYLGGPDTAYEAINGNLNVGGWADPGSVYDGDGSAWTRIKNLRSNYAAVTPYLDVREYIDYMTMWMFGNSEDEYRCVGPASAGSGFKFMLNDADGYLSINAWDSNTNNTTRSSPPPGKLPGDGPASIFSTLFVAANSDYRTLLADRIHRHLIMPGGMLTPTVNAARLTQRTNQVQRAMVAECARWAYRTPTNWAAARDQIFTSWFPTRTTEVLNLYRSVGFYPALNATVFSQQGGAVASGYTLTMTPGSGATNYYTTNGADPRLPGGAISPSALTGNSTVISQNRIIRARSKSGTQWSAINEAFFKTSTFVPAGTLAITEINYHPALDAAEEFIEFTNVGTQAINLRNAHVNGGATFDFPDNRDVLLAPGERLLIVENQLAFETRYGIGLPIAGVYRGSLSNDGDLITVFTDGNTQSLNFTFNDANPWPKEADGGGRTLVLANRAAGADYSSPLNWRASTTPGGNPAADDTAAFPGGDLLTYALAGITPPLLTRMPDGSMRLTHRRPAVADAVSYGIETSDTLATWFTTEATLLSQTVQLDGSVLMTWNIPPTALPSKFARVRVTLR